MPSSGYRGRLHTGQLDPSANRAVHDSVAAGIQVAGQLHDAALGHAVRVAFVHGMDLTLIVSGALALTGAIRPSCSSPAATYRRRRDSQDLREAQEQTADEPESVHDITV